MKQSELKTHEYQKLNSFEWVECNHDTANTFSGNPSYTVRKKINMESIQDYKEKIGQLINIISYYQRQSDEYIALKQMSEMELQNVQNEYFKLTDNVR